MSTTINSACALRGLCLFVDGYSSTSKTIDEVPRILFLTNIFFKHNIIMKKSILLLGLLLFSNIGWSQIATTILKWDKTGCQPNQIDQINYDSNFSTAGCLQVCQNSVMNYRLIGTNLPNVTDVTWTITGGSVETNQEFAVINWDDTNTGSIDIKLTFIDNTVIQRTICVIKLESQLVVSWDRIGCQAEENNVNEIKYSNMSLTNPCLKVCKDTNPTFSLDGANLTNIQTIQWLVTGGVAETPNEFATTILWDATNSGYITVRLKYFTGRILQKSICINKINSSLLLEWEKIDENTVHEIKLVNTDANKESILVYENSTVDYSIKGTNKNTIASLNWEVIGGFTENDSGFTVPVTWTDENLKELIVHISYVDGTTADENFAVLSKATVPCCPPPPPSNTLKFIYDAAGNQTNRQFIYITSGVWRQSKPATTKKVITKEKLIESDIYTDILYYPNPVQSELFIKWKNNEIDFVEKIEIYSLSGQILKTISSLKNLEETNIDFQSLPSGYYNLQIIYHSGEEKDLKIIKK
jgi:Secretion system C-terminal sorting domain